MKKVIAFAFALSLVVLVPSLATAAEDCGCTAMDVTCVNNCTLSKITALRKNI